MKYLALTLSGLLAASLLCTSLLQAEDEKKAGAVGDALLQKANDWASSPHRSWDPVSELRLGQGSRTGGTVRGERRKNAADNRLESRLVLRGLIFS
jgi:hypothetical protein